MDSNVDEEIEKKKLEDVEWIDVNSKKTKKTVNRVMR